MPDMDDIYGRLNDFTGGHVDDSWWFVIVPVMLFLVGMWVLMLKGEKAKRGCSKGSWDL